MCKFKKTSGFSIVEAMIGVALFVVFVSGLLTLIITSFVSPNIAGNRARAVLIAEEGLEAARNMRDNSFSNLSDGDHGLAVSGNQWQFNGAYDTTEIFERVVNVSTVSTDIKRLTATVTWTDVNNKLNNVVLISDLTNWQKLGIGNWSTMIVQSGLSLNGNQSGLDVMVQGNYAYFVRTNSTPNFAIIDITDPAAPILSGSLNLGGDLNAIYVLGNYAYVTSTTNNSEFMVIDITDKNAPIQVGTYNAPGNGDAKGLFVVGSTAYFTRVAAGGAGENEFYIINVTDPANPALLGSLNLESTANYFKISGNYAYLASTDNTREFQVIDISNSASPTRIFVYNINANGDNNSDAYSMEVYGTTALVGRLDGRFYPFNISNPLAPTLLVANGINLGGGNPNDMVAFNSNNYLAVATSLATAEVKILDISNIASAYVVTALNIGVGGNFTAMGIDYSAAADRLVLAGARISQNNNNQFTIVQPQ